MLDTDTAEVDYVEIPEEPQEVEEIVELIPVGGETSEEANPTNNQGKPRSIPTYVFINIYGMCPNGLYACDCALGY